MVMMALVCEQVILISMMRDLKSEDQAPRTEGEGEVGCIKIGKNKLEGWDPHLDDCFSWSYFTAASTRGFERGQSRKMPACRKQHQPSDAWQQVSWDFSLWICKDLKQKLKTGIHGTHATNTHCRTLFRTRCIQVIFA